MTEGDDQSQVPDSTSARRQARRKRRTRLGRFRSNVQWHSSTILTVSLALLVSGSLLAVGTVHAITLIFVAPLAILAGIFAIWVEDDSARRFPRLAIVAALLSAYSLFQSLPLPMRWVRVLSPVAAQTWTDAFNLAQISLTRSISLSIEPGASRIEAVKWIAYATAFVAAARLARQRGCHRGILIVVSAALFAGLLSVAHGLGQVEEWLFLYRPQFARPPWAVAPLLNPNNFAGYLNLSLFSAMGLLFAGKPKLPRLVSASAIVLLAALVILTGSRGGVLGLIVGFLVAGLTFKFQQSRSAYRSDRTLSAWVPIAGVGLASVALAVIGLTDVVWAQLLDETTGKLRIIEYSQPVIRDHLWFGVGRGAFGTAFAAYRQELGDNIYRYAENFVVQWIVEWGLPVAVVGLIASFWAMWPARHGFGRNAQQTAAFLAVGMLLIQNLVDLGTEIPSIGLAMFVLLGTIHGTTDYERDRRHKRSVDTSKTPQTRRCTLAALGILLPSIALFTLVVKTSLPEAIEQRSRLAKSFSTLVGKPKGHPDFERVRAEVTSALLRFPADPYIPLLGALLTRESGRSPYVWLNQALRRDPKSPRPHLLLAETLNARGNLSQAFLELKLTAKYAPQLVSAVADRALRWAPDWEMQLRAVPEGNAGVSVLNALAQRHVGTPERRRIRNRLLTLALERNPNDTNTNSLIVSDLLRALEGPLEPCLGDGKATCTERLYRHAKVVLSDKSQPQTATLLQARLLSHNQQFDEAERYLAERCGGLPDPVSCSHARVTYAQQLKDPNRFEDAAMAYATSACSTPVSCANAYNWLGNVELGRNNPMLALSRFERAAEELPTAEAWLKVAELAAQVGRYGRSETALATVRRLGGSVNTADLERRLLELRRTKMLRELEK